MTSTGDSVKLDVPTSLTGLMLQIGKCSDLEIKCQDRIFKVHRNVVCLQSKLFAAAVDSFMEGVTGEIDLEDQEAGVVDSMIQFLYHRDYSLSTVDASEGNILGHAKVYVIADRYDIPDLKLAAMKKYQAVEPIEWNSTSFSASIQLVYESTLEPDALRAVIAKAAASHMKELVDRGEFVALCQGNGEVAFDILKASLRGGETCVCGRKRPADAGFHRHNCKWGYDNNMQWYCSCGRYNDWS